MTTNFTDCEYQTNPTNTYTQAEVDTIIDELADAARREALEQAMKVIKHHVPALPDEGTWQAEIADTLETVIVKIAALSPPPGKWVKLGDDEVVVNVAKARSALGVLTSFANDQMHADPDDDSGQNAYKTLDEMLIPRAMINEVK